MSTQAPKNPPEQELKVDVPGSLMRLLARAGASYMANAFQACDFPGCTKHSLGFQCYECARTCCRDHMVFTSQVPPQPWCLSCATEYGKDQLQTPSPKRKK